MKQDEFDHLTRNIAISVSRRQFFKLLAAGLASTLLPLLPGCKRVDEGGGAGSSSCKKPLIECQKDLECCSGQCYGQMEKDFFLNDKFIKRCREKCKDDCTEAYDSIQKMCLPGRVVTYSDEDKTPVCCKAGVWFSDWNPNICIGCLHGKIFEPEPGEKCCNRRLYTRNSVRAKMYGKSLSEYDQVYIEFLNECEDCNDSGVIQVKDGQPGGCPSGQTCCGGQCIQNDPCTVCENGKVLKLGSEICNGQCYERCSNGKKRTEANNCNCKECSPCSQGQIPVSPESCDCKCATHSACLENQHWNEKNCRCECVEKQSCTGKEVWNEKICDCECPQITCTGGRKLNSLCGCECPAGQTWCASQGLCVNNCDEGFALNPNTCQCEDTFGCRVNGTDQDKLCEKCHTCVKGRCEKKKCGKCQICDETTGMCRDCRKGGCEVCQNDVCVSRCSACERCAPNVFEGNCINQCPDDQKCCNGQCVDASSNLNSCGSCSQKCNWDQICDNGTCRHCDPDKCETMGYDKTQGKWICFTCPPGLNCCNGQCVRYSSDPYNCGSCGNKCDVACCNGECRDVRSDNENCGTCSSPGAPTNCKDGYYCCNRKCIPMDNKCQQA